MEIPLFWLVGCIKNHWKLYVHADQKLPCRGMQGSARLVFDRANIAGRVFHARRKRNARSV